VSPYRICGLRQTRREGANHKEYTLYSCREANARTRWVCALTAAALVAAGCSGAGTGAPFEASRGTPQAIGRADGSPAAPEATPSPGPGPPAASYAIAPKQCQRRYRCAELQVPADHGNPGAGSITLELGILPAADEDRRIGVLLVNPGGPGQGMDGFLDYGAGLSPEVLDRFDVVGWNPRGTTAATTPHCQDESEELQLIGALSASPENEARIAQAAQQAAEACLAALDGQEHLIGTVQTVHDMELIRQALGEEQISYLGYSYGTILGQFYADLYGPNARAVVLDGVVDSSLSPEDVLVEQVRGFDRVADDVNRLVGRMTEAAGQFGRAAAAEARLCAYWPETDPRPRRAISAPEAPPILVVGNKGDGATPYEWAVAVAESLDTGVLLAYNGQSHTSYGRDRCVDEIVDDYLINLTVPPDGIECG